MKEQSEQSKGHEKDERVPWRTIIPILFTIAVTALLIQFYSSDVSGLDTEKEVNSRTGDPMAYENIAHGGLPQGIYGSVKPGKHVPLKPGKSKVLITGSAGFIGMHLNLELTRRGVETVGIDSYQGFYAVSLKLARANKIRQESGRGVRNVSVCDEARMTSLLRDEGITHVVHLAAQPGVRFSLDYPHQYVNQNVDCFVSMLQAIRNQEPAKRPHFVYASSSSVYGLNRQIPFSETHRVDRPSNLYGATKKSNEEIALSYNHLFGIRSIGCRFFTVYGEWGRPDMAVYKFAYKIDHGTPIPIYNQGKMKRDFTYVGDIVSGLVKILEWRDSDGSNQVFNLGNNHPEELMDLITILETSLGKNATIDDAGDSPGDIPTTFADLTLSKTVLDYEATVSLKEGVNRFMKWYRSDECKDGYEKILSAPSRRRLLEAP